MIPSIVKKIIAVEVLEKAAFFSTYAVITNTLLKTGLNEAEVAGNINFLRAIFYFSSIACVALTKLNRNLALIFFQVLSATGFLCLAFYSDKYLITIICLTIIYLVAGFNRNFFPAMIVDHCENRPLIINKCLFLLYWLVNLSGMTTQICFPIIYHNYGVKLIMITCSAIMAASSIFYFNGIKSYYTFISVNDLVKVVRKGSKKEIILLMICTTLFFCAYEQMYSSFTLHTRKMTNKIFNFTIYPEQLQTLCPLMIVLFTPLIKIYFLPWLESLGIKNRLGKIQLGILLSIVSFFIISLAEVILALDIKLNIIWDVMPYGLLSLAEIFFYVHAVELFTSYTNFKTPVMLSLFYGTGLLGNSAGIVIAKNFNEINYYFFMIYAILAIASFIFAKILSRQQGNFICAHY